MNKDVLHRYLFDNLHARGELVYLDQTFKNIIKPHQYPQAVEKLLGELVAATCLLTATLKFEGEIALQIQGNGPVAYMSVNGDHQQQMRAIAKLAEPTEQTTLKGLMGKGTLIITIRPKQGEPYQGVVALEQETLAECLAHYFQVSEQISTKIWLYHQEEKQQIAGCLLQVLPDSENKAQLLADFEHLCQLTNTIQSEEIFSIDPEKLLYRLYHQENVRLFEPQPVSFQCRCSKEKCLDTINQLDKTEIRAILTEQGNISITCDYCLSTYTFTEKDVF